MREEGPSVESRNAERSSHILSPEEGALSGETAIANVEQKTRIADGMRAPSPRNRGVGG